MTSPKRKHLQVCLDQQQHPVRTCWPNMRITQAAAQNTPLVHRVTWPFRISSTLLAFHTSNATSRNATTSRDIVLWRLVNRYDCSFSRHICFTQATASMLCSLSGPRS